MPRPKLKREASADQQVKFGAKDDSADDANDVDVRSETDTYIYKSPSKMTSPEKKAFS